MQAKIYSYHLYEVEPIQNGELTDIFNFSRTPKDIFFIFHSENCFSVKNEDGKYLTAFPDKRVVFFASKCSTWEKFYILDISSQKFIDDTITRGYVDTRGKKITKYELFLHKDLLLQVSLGVTLITPSYIPSSSYLDYKNHIVHKTYKQVTMLSKKRQIIYFCVYGKDEYYQCFELALKSLIILGGYVGDILVKTDNENKARDIVGGFSNKFYFSGIDESLGIFNRYYLHEKILQNYDSVVYLDCDILTIDLVNNVLLSFQEKGDFLAYIETDNKSYTKEYADRYTWWGANYLTYNNKIEHNDYFMYNSGFFVINNLNLVLPVFQRIIEYRRFETNTGDQPWLNLALYNSSLYTYGIPKNYKLSFSRNLVHSHEALDQVWIHFNSGVGNISKLNLMQSFFRRLL